jgi:multisubunit Na+/H+ antiporter MnhB subunit
MSIRSAFFGGAILSAAIVTTLFRYRRYPSFDRWWNAEGLPLWMATGMFVAVLIFG